MSAAFSNPKISICVDALRWGGVIAYPTEAVWGLGCDPFNSAAVLKLLKFKQRAPEKGLILIAGDQSQVEFLLEGLSKAERKKLDASWPGHKTWLIPHNNRVPPFLSGQYDTIAVRVSTHPVVKALCEKFKGPIVSTSANPQGYPPARNALKVRQYFDRDEIFLAPGIVGKADKPSEIFELKTGKQLR